VVTAEKLIHVILRRIAGPDGTAEVLGLDCNIVLTIAVRCLASCHGDVKVLLLDFITMSAPSTTE
jgi:multisubunit Na+/H+ antiporter MnhF subunit